MAEDNDKKKRKTGTKTSTGATRSFSDEFDSDKSPLFDIKKKPMGTKLYTNSSASSKMTGSETAKSMAMNSIQNQKSPNQLGADKAASTKDIMNREFSRGNKRDYSQDVDTSGVDLSFFKNSKARNTIRSLLRPATEIGNIKRDMERQKLGIDRQKIGATLAGNPTGVQSELANRTMGNLLNREAQDYQSDLKFGIPGEAPGKSPLDTLTNETNPDIVDTKKSERIAKPGRAIRPSIKKGAKKVKDAYNKTFEYTPPGILYNEGKRAYNYVYPRQGE